MGRPAKYITNIGLAAKAGCIVSGEEMTELSIRNGKAKLLILAKDASDHKIKKFEQTAEQYKIPVLYVSDRETLGSMIGKEFRATAAVLDSGFAQMIRASYKEAEKSSLLEE